MGVLVARCCLSASGDLTEPAAEAVPFRDPITSTFYGLVTPSLEGTKVAIVEIPPVV